MRRTRCREQTPAAWSPPAPVPDNDRVADPWVGSVRYTQLLAPRPPDVRADTVSGQLYPQWGRLARAAMFWHGGWWQWLRH